MKPKNMGPEELDLLKQILRNIKIPRHSDNHIINRLMVNGSYFEEAVIKPLEKMVGWTEDDEKNVIKTVCKIEEETQGKTLKEKNEKMKRSLHVRGFTIEDRIKHILKKTKKTEK